MVWFHKFEGTSTAKIRRALGFEDADRDRRVSYIVVFGKLDPITDLSDKQFLAAWWHICHYTFWRNKVHHRKVSPSNLMVYKTFDISRSSMTSTYFRLKVVPQAMDIQGQHLSWPLNFSPRKSSQARSNACTSTMQSLILMGHLDLSLVSKGPAAVQGHAAR